MKITPTERALVRLLMAHGSALKQRDALSLARKIVELVLDYEIWATVERIAKSVNRP